MQEIQAAMLLTFLVTVIYFAMGIGTQKLWESAIDGKFKILTIILWPVVLLVVSVKQAQ